MKAMSGLAPLTGEHNCIVKHQSEILTLPLVCGSQGDILVVGGEGAGDGPEPGLGGAGQGRGGLEVTARFPVC